MLNPRCLLTTLLLGLAAPLAAQLEPPAAGGPAELQRALVRLGHAKRVLLIGAHPDDEDTEFLTLMARGDGAQAAYLSLTRGEGGQNLIGPELGVALGMVRTEELLAARRIDGARQFFTRAYDFGYSKTLEDTWAHWPREELLKDVVRVIRRFRPQVIVAVFSGTPRDGHAHHQAAGVLAAEAYRVAGDPSVFPELGLPVWHPRKLYRSARFDSAATTLRLDGGALEPATGRSYHQLAMASRSRHRSQDMGQLQRLGPSAVRLALLDDRTGRGGAGFWSGIDTSLVALADDALPPGTPRSRAVAFLSRLEAALRRVRREPPVASPALAGALEAALALLGAARGDAALAPLLGDGPAGATLAWQEAQLAAAWRAARGVQLDARIARPLAARGDTLAIELEGYAPGRSDLRLFGELREPAGGRAGRRLLGSLRADLAPQAPGLGRAALAPLLLDGAEQPYFLAAPLDGALYRWDAVPADRLGLPFDPPPLAARFRWVRGADTLTAGEMELTARSNDQARGEIRSPFEVVPRLDLALAPGDMAWRRDDRTPREVTVTVTNLGADSVAARVALEAPAGWETGGARPVELAPGAREAVRFTVAPPAALAEGAAALRAVATTPDGTRFDRTRRALAYDHLHPRSWYEPAAVALRVVDVRLPALRRIGYVRGAADRVPEVLTQLGMPVELLDGTALDGDLSRFDVLVIGPRAFEVDPALAPRNARLLAFARAGGRVVVQYQQYAYFTGGLAPHPLFIASRMPGATATGVVTSRPADGSQVPVALLGGHDRVADERAPVRVLDPADPLVTVPNRLGPADWEGWVQERGLYFARAWDRAWRTVLETHDPGEGSLEGGLLEARVGAGSYVYTGLAFFRQLPAGVPGAVRLFANLLAPRP